MNSSRRTFVIHSIVGAGALGCAGLAQAQATATAAMLSPSDPAASALAYVEDATKSKHAKYAAGQLCSNCMLYQGKATDANAACGAFGGKRVVGKGWCAAWVKKA